MAAKLLPHVAPDRVWAYLKRFGRKTENYVKHAIFHLKHLKAIGILHDMIDCTNAWNATAVVVMKMLGKLCRLERNGNQ